jgi:hypothetical protein
MENSQSFREVERLRFAFQMNSRLNLEFRGTLSKLLREYDHTLDDRLLGELVLALPGELPGMGPMAHPLAAASSDSPPQKGKRPGPKKNGPKKPPGQSPPQTSPPQKLPPQTSPPQKAPAKKSPPQTSPPQKGAARKSPPQTGAAKKRSASRKSGSKK